MIVALVFRNGAYLQLDCGDSGARHTPPYDDRIPVASRAFIAVEKGIVLLELTGSAAAPRPTATSARCPRVVDAKRERHQIADRWLRGLDLWLLHGEGA